ncbi:MAG: HNH endonuclease [Bacteroidetes bacterium]|nr:HNH endonuclease [Bacteroidota bacterium]
MRETPKIWTEKEIAFIKANYETMTAIELADVFTDRYNNVTRAQVKNKIYKLRLHKTTNKGQFKKGQISLNKGKKGTHYSPATEFKKGHLPHNTKADGVISIRLSHRNDNPIPYKWIRVSLRKWELLHRYLWIQRYGKIPKGYNIIFKNGNTLDCRLNNLAMVSRDEHLQMNHKYHSSDGWIASTLSHKNPELKKLIMKNPELIELKRKQLELQRKINEHRKTA